jgi:ribosomal protein L16/L10AE
MGQGKGAPHYWGTFIRPGNILYEIPKRVKRGRTAISAIAILKKMLPIKTRLISKNCPKLSSNGRSLKTLDLKRFTALYKYLYKKFY